MPHSASRERPAAGGRRLDLLWTPAATSLILLAPAVIGVLLGKPALFPSLGPSALVEAHEPERASSRPYNVIVSHLVGLGSAFLAVTLVGISREPSVFEVGALSIPRVAAALLAVFIAAFLELVLRAQHSAAASTTLLAALGSFKPTLEDTLTVVVGLLSLVVVGEMVRRLRLRLNERNSV